MNYANTLRIWMTGLSGLILFFMLVSVSFSKADEVGDSSPSTMLEKVSRHTLEKLRQNRSSLENDPESLKKIIRDEIFPYIDRVRMAQWALGKHWRRATREQRIAFSEEFQDLLLRTYATALLKYIDAQIEFKPDKLVPGDRQAIVRSEVVLKSSPKPVSIDYRLYLSNNQWRVFDISIEDVSLIASYRTTFSREISQQGLSGLIESLHKRNQETEKDPS